MSNNVAVIYVRFSTPRQERGDSRRRQLDDCREYCRIKGLEVVEVVEDLGRSAYRGDHLAFGNMGKLTQRILGGEIDPGTTIVVEKLDRLSREKPRVLRRWLEDVCDRGLRIARVAGGPIIDAEWMDNGSNLAAIIDIAYQSSAGHEFSQNISYRLSKFWEQKRQRVIEGRGLLTAKVPAWIDVVGEWRGKNTPDLRHFEINQDRAKIVLQIYQLAADGMGSWGIAKVLNQAGIPSWGNRAATSTRSGWNHTSVLNILKSPAVEGIHRLAKSVNGKSVDTGDALRDYYPLIEGVNADLIARARAQLIKRQGGAPKSNSGKNLLASLARCGSCGGYMVLRNRSAKDGPYAYLQCDNAGKSKGCGAKGMFNYRLLEPAILDAMLHLTLDDTFFSVADESVSLRISIAEHDRQLLVALEERDNTRALLRRFPDDDQLTGDWQRLSARVRDMEIERANLTVRLSTSTGAIGSAEHLKRVHDFKGALYDENAEVRRNARLRVRDAFRAIISHVDCSQDDHARWVDVALADGLLSFRFDHQGKLLSSINHSIDVPVTIRRERDYPAENTRRLAGEAEFDEAGKFLPIWRTIDVTVPPSDKFVEGFKHDHPEQAAAVDSIIRRQRTV